MALGLGLLYSNIISTVMVANKLGKLKYLILISLRDKCAMCKYSLSALYARTNWQ